MAKYLSQRIEWLEKAEISFLKAKISDGETEIENLNLKTRKSRLTLQHRIDELEKLKNALSPIRRVPFDILSEIFILSCCDKDFGNRPKQTTTAIRYTPLILASVCVAWKTVTHKTPEIWAVLYLRLGDTKSRCKDQAWVQRWISRSRGLPLELHLQYSSGYIYFPLYRTREVMDTILSFRHRCSFLLAVLFISIT
ncbi:hypothetical protein BDP27DRAFT_1296055 [Rhodocollybia butyracea]|uniref:F-box domain-containing protein n=1 Tax=Rhodocollybia butyracea TaxID=206335 RepID=A0A9P5U6E5_9AGAR|nr:hypothetical protein BDP27DRAFT_1296055 [Rhodocollybia butyracea]